MYLRISQTKMAGGVIGMLLALAAAFMLGSVIHAMPSFPSSPLRAVLNPDMILEKLESIKELHTAVATIQTVVSVEDVKEIFGLNIGSTKMLYVAVGNVRAGVDMRKLGPEAIKIVDGNMKLTLPPAEILDVKLDLDKCYVYDLQKKLFAPKAVGLQNEAEQKAYAEVKKAALASGVLDLANDCAKRAMEKIE